MLTFSDVKNITISQYLSDANDVESWITEKAQLVASQDYGRDEDAAAKLLTKHKVQVYLVQR